MASRSSEIGGEETDLVRTTEEVTRRALALGAAVAAAYGAERQELLDWLSSSDLLAALSPSEKQFLLNENPAEKQNISFSWRVEALAVLLWAIGKILPRPSAVETTRAIDELIPPYGDEPLDQFIKTAQLLPTDELFDAAFEYQELHAESRNASILGKGPRRPVDRDIIQERHYAINWVVGYCGQEWDEITTDT